MTYEIKTVIIMKGKYKYGLLVKIIRKNYKYRFKKKLVCHIVECLHIR